LPKTGDLSNPNKWRGIALGDIAAKCISSIIATRLTQHLVSFGMDEQCGSIYKKGCVDATFSLKLALQTLHEHNKEAYVLFVDLVKAYDSVNRELLWKVLKRFGVPNKMITVLQKLHKNIKYAMKVGKKSVKVISTCGVKQGDNLGPILFIYLIQAISTTLDKKWDFETPDFRWHGIQEKNGQISPKYKPNLAKGTSYLTKGEKISFWMSYYVDDAAFLFLNRKDIEKASPMIVHHFSRFGLTVHYGDKRNDEKSKTEAMYIPRPGQQSNTNETKNIEIDDNRYFSFSKKFKYLGSIFSNTLDDTEDIERRIQQATAAFASLSEHVLHNKKISKKLRKRTYETLIINLLLWGCESWALKEHDRQRLETCHHRCIRRMLNITIYDVQEQKITNEQTREKMNNMLSITQMMELHRARWLEKISTANSNRNTRKMLVAWIPTPRPSGCPQ
jgi:Reverse transcriptase (RNA-dependent DNA polymerase)